MKKMMIMTILVISFFMLNAQDTITIGPTGDHPSWSHMIENSQCYSSGDIVEYQTGTYTNLMNVDFDLTIREVAGHSVVISTAGIAIRVSGGAEITILGLTIHTETNSGGNGIHILGNSTVTVEECVIDDIDNHNIFLNTGSTLNLTDTTLEGDIANPSGTGIHAEGGVIDATNDCIIKGFVRGIKLHGDYSPSFTAEDIEFSNCNSAIYLQGGSASVTAGDFHNNQTAIAHNDRPLVLIKCDFWENTQTPISINLGVEGTVINIVNCRIYDNSESGISMTTSNQAVDVNITKCLIENNDDHGITVSCNSGLDLDIVNCTITNNGTTSDEHGIENSQGTDPDNMTIINSIIWNNFDDDQISDANAIVSYSCIEDGYAGMTNSTIANPNLDANYNLTWDSTAMSPCIDRGDPNEDTDTDGTCSDMGCFPAETHEIRTESFNAGITWLSFPALQIVTDSVEVGTLMTRWGFNDGGAGANLDEILWFYDGTSDKYHYYNGNWQNGDHDFASVEGYKFDMDAADAMTTWGPREAPDTDLLIDVGAYNRETWLGYFIGTGQHPEDAFPSTVLDSLIMVKHQDWAGYLIHGEWEWPEGAAINYGDMVVVRLHIDQVEDISFEWYHSARNTDDIIDLSDRPASQHFNWTEELDYVPIFVDFDATNRPDEVAVYAGSICMGACAVSALDTFAQINGYIMDENNQYDDSNLSFVLYYDNRAKTQTINQYYVQDIESGVYYPEVINTGNLRDVYFVSNNPDNPGSIPPPPLMEMFAYPNPFNPSTHIRYDIPEASDVSLNIYNIKGQLVSTLVNDYREAGSYQTEWKGTTTNGKPAASGVYFTRLKSGTNVKTQKLMLLK
ncbi:MAG: right-handed parallel beta-helix repeat-containing protein [Candidatus Cloacimonetes bacterium]|nr:right-handed parallel beta-helix repeat-containing protein [Candidatus Cloacimonadota bacterium]